jgi:hypothetical protein
MINRNRKVYNLKRLFKNMTTVIVVTRGDDGWVLGSFYDMNDAREYVDEEVDDYDPYECDYWETEVSSGGSELNP